MLSFKNKLEEQEKTEIIKVLKQTGGNISKTAEILGLGRATIYRKMQKFGIEIPPETTPVKAGIQQGFKWSREKIKLVLFTEPTKKNAYELCSILDCNLGDINLIKGKAKKVLVSLKYTDAKESDLTQAIVDLMLEMFNDFK